MRHIMKWRDNDELMYTYLRTPDASASCRDFRNQPNQSDFRFLLIQQFDWLPFRLSATLRLCLQSRQEL
jgi:hypothetical protein